MNTKLLRTIISVQGSSISHIYKRLLDIRQLIPLELYKINLLFTISGSKTILNIHSEVRYAFPLNFT